MSDARSAPWSGTNGGHRGHRDVGVESGLTPPGEPLGAAGRGGIPGGSPPPPASSSGDAISQLKQLGELKASGILTEAEFEAQKAKILSS